MSDYQRETLFLKECVLYDRSGERLELFASITALQNDQRCIRRATWLMVFLVALAFAGACYSVILFMDYPSRLAQFIAPLTLKIFGTLSVASLICLMAFVVLGMMYRSELDQRRQECRDIIAKLLESELRRPRNVLAAGRDATPLNGSHSYRL